MALTIEEKRARFAALHQRGCFVMPNPFDVGSARYLESAGFQALATTSSGAAWTFGYADGAVPLDLMLEHIRDTVEAVDLPVNADFLEGYARDPKGVAENVSWCVGTGVAGLSIEDATGDPDDPLFDFDLAVERIIAAREAIDATGTQVLLTARAECYLTGHPTPREEAIRRLVAFAEAGADCLYAPGPTSTEDIAAIVSAVAPKPVNLLVRGLKVPTVDDLAALGVRRVSVGGLLARMAWNGLIAGAEALREGRLDGFANAAPGAEIEASIVRR